MLYKRICSIFLTLVFVCSLMPSSSSGQRVNQNDCTIILKYTIGNKQYFVNDVPFEMETEPEIKDSRTFLVITYVVKHIPGATIDWTANERKITIKTPLGKIIKLWIDNPKAEVDGKMVDIDPDNPGKAAPYIRNSRTKVPMRFVGNHLNAKIDWIASTSMIVLTIQDIATCGCSWLEGCIVQWTEAPNNQYQLSFVQNCDKKSTLERYLIDKNVKSTTTQLDLTEYLKKSPKPPYPTTRICLNQFRKILKWDPGTDPGTNPPPSDKKGQIVIQVPKEFYYGTVIQIIDQASEDEKIYAVNSSGTCYTGCELICGNTYIIEPINHKVLFTPPTRTVTIKKCCPIEYEEVTFDARENTCCDYKLFQLSVPILSLKPDVSEFYVFMLRNTCPPDSKNISFQITPISNITNINPKQLVLLPGQELTFKVSFTMPKDCPGNTKVTFSFKMETDCGKKEEQSFMIQCDSPEAPPEPTYKWICGCFSKHETVAEGGTKIWFNANCNEATEKWKGYLIPKDLKDQNLNLLISEYVVKYPIKKYKSLCIELYVDENGSVKNWKATPEKYPDCCKPSAKKGRIVGNIQGTCNPGVTVTIYDGAKGDIVWIGQTDNKGYYETSPADACILKCPGTYKVVPSKEKYAFRESSKLVTFTEDDCCGSDPVNPQYKRADFIGETTADPGRIIANLDRRCVGVSTTFVNLSNPKVDVLTVEANIKGNCDTDCKVIFGDTYRVTPKNEKFRFIPEFIDVTVLESCPNGIIRISFDATEIPSSCCDYQFRVNPDAPQEFLAIAPGEIKTIEMYEIINTCRENGNELNFLIRLPEDRKINSISPTIFKLRPSERKSLKITIKMPEDSHYGDVVTFPFTIQPIGCEEKAVHFVVYCKIKKCEKTSANVKVLEIDMRTGVLSGKKMAESPEGKKVIFASPITIHFEIDDDYWKRITVNHCYEICFEEKNDSGGKAIKWGLDYREIECQ